MRRAVSLALVLLSACAGTRVERPTYASAEGGWIMAPHTELVLQEARADCGAAALTMVLRRLRADVVVEDLRRAVGPPTEAGVSAGLLRDIARQHGVRAFLIEGTLADLTNELQAGRAVLVGLMETDRRRAVGHYAVVVGLHPGEGRVLLADPLAGWSDTSVADFEAKWQPAGHLTLVVLPAQPNS